MDNIETWVPIKNFEGLYEISSIGRIKTMGKYKGKGNNIYVPEGLMKPYLNDCGKGYYIVDLLKLGRRKSISIHRLVALHFIDNPMNYKFVNHLDGDTRNNIKSNLEWCTPLQNTQHAWATGLINNIGGNNINSRPVIQMDLGGNEIARFESCLLAEKSFGFKRSHINRLCNNNSKHRTCYGFKWKYAV